MAQLANPVSAASHMESVCVPAVPLLIQLLVYALGKQKMTLGPCICVEDHEKAPGFRSAQL